MACLILHETSDCEGRQRWLLPVGCFVVREMKSGGASVMVHGGAGFFADESIDQIALMLSWCDRLPGGVYSYRDIERIQREHEGLTQ